MLRRLTKSRRHSADEAVDRHSPTSRETIQDDASVAVQLRPRKSLEGQIQALNAALLNRVSRNKYARRSCGDAPSAQSYLVGGDQRSADPRSRSETDYQTVTAVPAYIVEHEPESKPRQQQQQPSRGLGVWSRRMSKKIESFRRSGSRESMYSPVDASESNDDHCIDNNNNGDNNDDARIEEDRERTGNVLRLAGKSSEGKKAEGKGERRYLSGNCHGSPSPFKSFFIRMGSTGMLNSAKINNGRSGNLDNGRTMSGERENLFRSCSTSHLNESPTYVKGDDPSDGIDLRIGQRRDKTTLSCDDLAIAIDESDHGNDSVFDSPKAIARDSSSVKFFGPCDSGNSRNETPRKASGCDLRDTTRKCNFPYAFLRSKLSVLPEERRQKRGGAVKDEARLVETTSEKNFPGSSTRTSDYDARESGNGGGEGNDDDDDAENNNREGDEESDDDDEDEDEDDEDTIDGARKALRGRSSKSRNPSKAVAATHRRENDSRYRRNSLVEIGSEAKRSSVGKASMRAESDHRRRYSLNPSALDLNAEGFCLEAAATRRASTPMSEFVGGSYSRRINEPWADPREGTTERRFSETSSLNAIDFERIAAATLRDRKRNSTPSAEHRLSSHYVSSNESGYDSDGPRGETFLVVSENEVVDPRYLGAEGSDTSSAIDTEMEKSGAGTSAALSTAENVGSIDGLGWHRSNSGRILPSIHRRGSYARTTVDRCPLRPCIDSGPGIVTGSGSDAIIQETSSLKAGPFGDETKLSANVLQSAKRIRRCRLVQLGKRDSRESLGIRLAQENVGEPRYIVVQLENGGIAHRDGRLRLGDEIVQIEGKDLKTLDGLTAVQEFLKSFSDSKTVRLVTSYEETLPRVLGDGVDTILDTSEETRNYRRINFSSTDSAILDRTSEKSVEVPRLERSFDDRPTIASPNATQRTRLLNNSTESQQSLTRHVATFEKGYGKPSLGFSVVGGRDSPRGDMGIFVRRIFPGGQADVSKLLLQGDEILSLNGKILRGCTHQEVIELFKAVRVGPMKLDLARRHRCPRTPMKTLTCQNGD